MEKSIDRQQISDYYNTFCEEEKDLRLNVRHYTVFKHLVKAGLKKNHAVLEIGCGFGTITSLMSRFLKNGTITATDISAERIASCQRQFKDRPNATFVLSDMSDFRSAKLFDFIVLPDVLEHIPVEAHQALFDLMARILKEDGTLFIHIPHPSAIEYWKKYNPSVLQIIDQAIASDQLLRIAYTSGFILKNLEAYSLANEQLDYEWVVFKKKTDYVALAPIPSSKTRWRKALAKFFFWRKTLF
ncbi:MAG: class I SAM-dependent methyltransferase [Flavobacteriales bacterium]|nr:class I SAM-dependent methyltransferase [Flavobacteriales bacterium]